MTHSAAEPTADYDGLHDGLYATPPPWDIQRPQPAFLALADAGVLRGRVLDVGCGTGEHALLAARLGLDATGVDLSAKALALAAEKAEARGLKARFLRHDVRRLAEFGEAFDVVLDSLVLHGLRGADRAEYVEGLHAVLRPGGRCFLLSFRDEPPARPGRVHRVTRDEIRAAFEDGWRIDSIEAVTIASVPLPGIPLPDGIRGWCTALTRI